MNSELINGLNNLLEQMVDEAFKGNEEAVLGLNQSYEQLRCKESSELYLEYDNCRQSCIMSFKMPDMRQKFLADAKKRLNKVYTKSENLSCS